MAFPRSEHAQLVTRGALQWGWGLGPAYISAGAAGTWIWCALRYALLEGVVKSERWQHDGSSGKTKLVSCVGEIYIFVHAQHVDHSQ